MVKHLDEYNITHPRQFGFQRGHSTSDAVLNLTGEVLKAMDDDLFILSIFIDLKKAFDTASHQQILRKLNKIGVCGTELNWFQSFLSERHQFTCLDNCSSPCLSIEVGVPQGSLLSVLIFQLIITYLPNSLWFCSSILYADNTTIFIIGRNLKFLKQKMQNDLENLLAWLWVNELMLNVKKTKCILFNREGLTPKVTL